MKLDVRNLEPPQPMIRIMQALEKLKRGETLEVLGSRPFTHLLPRLEEMGYAYQLEEAEEGYVLIIWHKEEVPSKEKAQCLKELDFEINENTNVGKLLERVPESIDILIKYGFTPAVLHILYWKKFLPFCLLYFLDTIC
ncbi:MAG: sulfurtransferase TusA family protein [Alishewanella aestuarii]